MSAEERHDLALTASPGDADWQAREDARVIQYRKQFALTQAADLAKELIRANRGGDGNSLTMAADIVAAARVFDKLLSES